MTAQRTLTLTWPLVIHRSYTDLVYMSEILLAFAWRLEGVPLLAGHPAFHHLLWLCLRTSWSAPFLPSTSPLPLAHGEAWGDLKSKVDGHDGKQSEKDRFYSHLFVYVCCQYFRAGEASIPPVLWWCHSSSGETPLCPPRSASNQSTAFFFALTLLFYPFFPLHPNVSPNTQSWDKTYSSGILARHLG